jgi:Flp pilus assembly pilin Flp
MIIGWLSSLKATKVLANDVGRYCNMDKGQLRRLQRGQGLVEYGVVIILIALGVILAAAAIGTVGKRLYGIIAGATGAKKNATSVIEIQDATCYVELNHPETGVVIHGLTNADPTKFKVTFSNHTDGQYTLTDGLHQLSAHPDTLPGTFIINPFMSDTVSGRQFCPVSVVIEAPDGSIAISPVVEEDY